MIKYSEIISCLVLTGLYIIFVIVDALRAIEYIPDFFSIDIFVLTDNC
jgi:hypothetical protein